METIRVLQIVPNLQSAGVENFIMNIYRNIDRQSVQFDFLVHYKKPCFFDDEVKKLGGRIYKLSVREDYNIAKYLMQLNRFFKAHPEYKIVHGHMPAFGGIYFSAAKANGVPVRISHSHNTSTENTAKGFVKRIVEKATKYPANVHFACSRAAGMYLFGKEDFTVINNAIKTERFSYNNKIRADVRAELGAANRFVVGHAGRFCEQKNHSFLVDIFAQIHKKDSSALLLLAGAGELMPVIKEKVKRLGLTNHVLFLGVRGDIDRLYQAMDAFVLPSHFEGLPVVGIEAQAAGLPCFFADTITDETAVTPLARFLPLKEAASYWAKQILEAQIGFIRKDMTGEITQAGYEIKTAARNLENYYRTQYDQLERK